MKENMMYDTDLYQLRDFVLYRMLEIIQNQKSSQPGGIVFFGDSITEYCDLKKWFPDIQNSYNCGVAGITSDMLLHFLDEGVIKYQPNQVVIMVGTNDLGNTVMASPRSIALNVKEMIEIISENLPRCQIYLVSCLPCLEKIHGYKATKQGLRSNDILKMIFKEYKNMIHHKQVQFINAYPALCNKKGEPIESYYKDGLHLNEMGYSVYTNELQRQIKENYEK